MLKNTQYINLSSFFQCHTAKNHILFKVSFWRITKGMITIHYRIFLSNQLKFNALHQLFFIFFSTFAEI